MNARRILSLTLSVIPCLVVLAALLLLAGDAAGAPGITRRVATTFSDTGDCAVPNPPCGSVQYAVDVAAEGDLIVVAAGVYTGVLTRPAPSIYVGSPVITQVVLITKTVTVRGGYTTTNDFAGPPDPLANPTTLDAGGQGRVIHITAPAAGLPISPTIEDLRLTGGDATGLGGGLGGTDFGGGLFAQEAAATINNCIVYSNTASTGAGGHGGGLYITQGAATLEGNTIISNTASTAPGKLDRGRGGGLYLKDSGSALSGNTIAHNVASFSSEGYGGGLALENEDLAIVSGNTVQDNRAGGASYSSGGGVYLTQSAATLEGNTIVSNTASTASNVSAYAFGGGLALNESAATLSGNWVLSNTATTAGWGLGGGTYLYNSHGATLSRNVVRNNTASSGSNGRGGGLYLTSSAATLSGNYVVSNTANTSAQLTAGGQGGGLLMVASNCTLSDNQIIGNTASQAASFSNEGGGLWVYGGGIYTLTNNVLANNHAYRTGGGLWFGGLTNNPTVALLRHTTIAANTGGSSGGQGIHLAGYATLALTNTIVSGHPLVGLYASNDSTATLQATLWYGNGSETGGPGHIVTGTVDLDGDPAFVDPSTWDYHLSAGSAAIDEGVEAGVVVDIDGQPRPLGSGYDIGADEYGYLVYLPLLLR